MCGWFSVARTRASRSRRVSRSGSERKTSGTGSTASAGQVQSLALIQHDQDAAKIPVESVDRAERRGTASEVLDWNQIFIDTLIATNTANSSSQRLGAIVHTAIFDAYNGIERRYAPIFVHDSAPAGASSRAAVVAAAYTALVGLFGPQQRLDDGYAASLAALSQHCEDCKSRGQGRSCTQRIERGVAWGIEVAQAVLAWRATDGFNGNYVAFNGGTAVGQWRPRDRIDAHQRPDGARAVLGG
jgi:hypothetical protein